MNGARPVADAVRRCLEVSEQAPPRRSDWPTWLPRGGASIPPAALTELVQVLRAQPELAIFDGQMQQFASQARRVSLEGLARWLVDRAFSVGVEDTTTGLYRYVSEPTYDVEESSVLAGVKVSEPLEVADGILLVPYQHLSETKHKAMFMPTTWDATAIARPWPEAALTCRNKHPRHHLVGNTPEMATVPTRHPEMADIRLLLTLIGPSSPVIIASWSVPDPWVPLGDLSAGWSFTPPEGFGRGTVELTGAACERLREVYGFFETLTSDEKQHLRIPLERLNRALRRTDSIGSAIELGIALEALFLNDQQDDRGELAFRLSVRGARFLGTTLDARRNVDSTLRSLYKLRSVAVHSGKVPGYVRGQPTTELLDKGYRLTATAIERVIRQGGSPNWTDLVLE